MRIVTRQFILRPFRKSDAPQLAKNINHRLIARNTTHIPYPYTLGKAKRWLGETVKEYRLSRPTKHPLAIEMEGEPIGCVSLSHIVYGHQAVLGYWLAYRYWGQGVMSRAVKQMTNLGFKKFRLVRISATVFSFNKASMRVLLKNGFRKEGFRRKVVRKGKKYFDDVLFGKVR